MSNDTNPGSENKNRAHCMACEDEVSITSGKFNLTRHEKTMKHITNLEKGSLQSLSYLSAFRFKEEWKEKFRWVKETENKHKADTSMLQRMQNILCNSFFSLESKIK